MKKWFGLVLVGIVFSSVSEAKTSVPSIVPDAAAIAKGKAIYGATCIACHGTNGKGTIPGVPSFLDKEGPLSKDDRLLVQHALEGFQSPGSPMAMPPKGGNSSLTREDLVQVIHYIRKQFGPKKTRP